MKTNLSTIIKTARLAAGRWFVATVLLCAAGVCAAEPTFTNVTATVVPGLRDPFRPCTTWGDYDNDGRLDFLLMSFFGGPETGWQPANQMLTAQEDGTARWDDPDLLNRAGELGRVLFSQDEDLLAEAALRPFHWSKGLSLGLGR